MKKTLFLATVAIVAMASCTKETFVGQTQGLTQIPIAFSNANPAFTKADPTPADYAEKLGNSFVVYGWKNVSSASSVVFDHYNVEFKTGTDNSTPSNLVGWEYVNINPVNKKQDGKYITTQVGEGSFSSVANQTIKYWDVNASKYEFIAFSRGLGVKDASGNTNYAQFSTVDITKIGSTIDPVYTATGTVEELAQIYVADMNSINNSATNFVRTNPVTPEFRSASAKVRVAFYETVPGYSVKGLTFYNGNTQTSENKVELTVVDGTESLPSGSGTMKVFIDKTGKADVKYFSSSTGTAVKTLNLGSSIALDTETESNEDNSVKYLGRESNTASYSNNTNKDLAYKNVPSMEVGVDLKVKVGYTLVSIDGKGEEIEVGPVEAVIPATYTAWQPNYAYTYIFKISDKTAGLEPITLSAVVSETQSGLQETVTEVLTPSITTYAKGENPTGKDEYKKGINIYVSVNGKTLTSDNVKLYTATVETGACQGVTEGSVANALALINTSGYKTIVKASEASKQTLNVGDPVSNYYTLSDDEYTPCAPNAVAVASTDYYSIDPEKITAWIIKDANNKKMTISKSTETPSIEIQIAAADAPDGTTAITGNFAKFIPTAAGTYVFEYTDAASSKKYYKIIKVVD